MFCKFNNLVKYKKNICHIQILISELNTFDINAILLFFLHLSSPFF